MPDAMQRYRPAHLSKVQQYLTRRDTTSITIPGQPWPVLVPAPRPRQWPWLLLAVGAVIGTAVVMARVLVPTAGTAPPPRTATLTGCVPDTVHLIVSKVKDRLKVLIDETQVTEIKYGEVVNLDGSVERTFKGPAWGQLDLTPHVKEGKQMLRLVATHDQGRNFGAVVEVKQNGKSLAVLGPGYGLSDRHGEFLNQSIPLYVQTCQEHSDERSAHQYR